MNENCWFNLSCFITQDDIFKELNFYHLMVCLRTRNLDKLIKLVKCFFSGSHNSQNLLLFGPGEYSILLFK
jgi:hypothetical protein